MKKISLLMLLCLSYTAAAQTENAETRGKRVVKEAIAALGGDAFLHMRNRVETGRAYSFYHQKLHGLSIARFYTEYISPQELSPKKPATKKSSSPCSAKVSAKRKMSRSSSGAATDTSLPSTVPNVSPTTS